jgi:hypothetical protein
MAHCTLTYLLHGALHRCLYFESLWVHSPRLAALVSFLRRQESSQLKSAYSGALFYWMLDQVQQDDINTPSACGEDFYWRIVPSSIFRMAYHTVANLSNGISYRYLFFEWHIVPFRLLYV